MAVKQTIVIGILAFFALAVSATPFLHPPRVFAHRIGLGSFQVAVALVLGLLALTVLLVASWHGIIWRRFARPSTIRQGVRESRRFVALALAAEFLLFVGIVGLGFVAFASNTVLPPSLAGLQEALRALMVLVAVAAAMLLVRVIILLGLALGTRATSGSCEVHGRHNAERSDET